MQLVQVTLKLNSILLCIYSPAFILLQLYSVQHWGSAATCAAALGLPNLNYVQVAIIYNRQQTTLMGILSLDVVYIEEKHQGAKDCPLRDSWVKKLIIQDYSLWSTGKPGKPSNSLPILPTVAFIPATFWDLQQFYNN